MPESKRPATTKRFMRGTTPAGPGVPSGEIRLTTSPVPTPSWRASSAPIRSPGSSTFVPPSSGGSVMGCGVASAASVPFSRCRSRSTTAPAICGSMPRTTTPAALRPTAIIACP